jgi:DNA mismatch repair protein MutS2
VADAHTLAVLELPELLERLASLAASAPGKDMCRRLSPSADAALVERRQRRLAQLRQLLDQGDPPGLAGLEDARPLLGRLRVEGVFLTPPELASLADFLRAAGSAHAFLAPSQGVHDELFRLANRITPLNELAREVAQVVGPGGTVRSAASPELGRVRRELTQARERLSGQLSRLFQEPGLASAFSDQVVTQRAERFVVPVKADAKGKVAGIIHDTSHSGATCFVEPLEAVEGNNQLGMLRRREREEEERILAALSRKLAGQLQAMEENLAALAQLDCLLAQAELARRLDCHQPELDAGGGMELIRARHPLLAWRQARGRGRAVPIQVGLAAGQRVLVISGANAGGKTATIKTVGLITLMALCGMQVPCLSGSRVGLFRRVLAEVGDDQSLETDLSTFTAHAGRLAQMVRAAGEDSLVLVDELGTGTDPGEGAALGMAVLEWLRGRGARVLCTTHFHRLKAYAAATEGVENVSVAFDDRTGEPTYQLHYGRAGFSDALAVSRGLGFPPGLVDHAESLVEASERQTVELLKEAEAERQEAARLAAQAREEAGRAAAERRRAVELRKEAAARRSQALAEGKRRVREVARRLEQRLEELYARARADEQAGREAKPGAVRQELYQARRQALQEAEAVAAPPRPERPEAGAPGELKAGARVRLTRLNQTGVLAEDLRPGDDTVAVVVGKAGVRVQVPAAELEPAEAGAGSRPPAGRERPRPVSVQASADDGLDLKVIGLTVDDALPLVDKALDQAVLAGRHSLKVVHGIGTGRLRQGVRDYLGHHPLVASVHPDAGPHGNAVTVAELRG